MLSLLTANNTELPISWIGISDFDGSLRFEVLSDDMDVLYRIFTDPEQTKTLTRIFDGDEKSFEGYTVFKGIERMGTGNIVVRMMKGAT